MKTVRMTQKELERLIIPARVKEEEMSLRLAAGVLGLSYRQAKRVWRRFPFEGGCWLGASIARRAQSTRHFMRSRS